MINTILLIVSLIGVLFLGLAIITYISVSKVEINLDSLKESREEIKYYIEELRSQKNEMRRDIYELRRQIDKYTEEFNLIVNYNERRILEKIAYDSPGVWVNNIKEENLK